MSIYYRNSQQQVAESVGSRKIWIDVFDPQSEFQDVGGKPYGFDVGMPGEYVTRKEIAVAGINSGGESDVFIAVVFVNEEEVRLGLTSDKASVQAWDAGFNGDVIFCEDSEKQNLIAGVQKLLHIDESKTADSVCADLVNLNRESPFSDDRLQAICSEATQAILTPDPLKGFGLDVVLASLRWFQSCKNGEHDMSEIADIADPDEITSDFIDELCCALNVEREDKLESFASLVISTGHMASSDRDTLSEMATEESSRVSNTYYGYRCRLNQEMYCQDYSGRGLSTAILKVFDFAVANGFGAIEFDCDGDTVPELEVFDW